MQNLVGYMPDEKLRLQELRRRWLKDQELNPWEPSCPHTVWPLERFWNNFAGGPFKYHVATEPYAIVDKKPRIFPGDAIPETGEVIPPMKDFPDQHH
ncbi:NADH dehydrogenase [ubiquinone] 1 beta subcomplex subunit 6-like [Psammomys obesus]|uniref:NADH dehydrogenase [ubiquinone] 1 beta subcomplex subunit 6-like n=1 Tax=Psammomys obesus TaxID=48139 RepID=UPI00245307FD|nr:NADH dehydrogenase [ubiquinone] 1 beta subcomplex subunit 6-like [Psammomys obesus]